MTNDLKLKENSGVYVIQCKENGRMYIGSSKRLRERISNHKRCLEDGNHHCIDLQLDYNKYGKENFDIKILEYCNEADARKRELEYIDNLNIKKFGYNTYDFKDSIRKKYNMFYEKCLNFAINKGYESDDNIWLFSIFDLSKEIKMTVSKIIHSFGVDSNYSWNMKIEPEIEEDEFIGITWCSDAGVVFYVCNRNAMNGKPDIIECY